MSKRFYQQRVIAETTMGERPAAGTFAEVQLPGSDLGGQASLSPSSKASPSLAPKKGVSGNTAITWQSTTDFMWRNMGEALLQQSAFGATETPAVVAVGADSMTQANNALVRSTGWGGTNVTAGQMLLVTGATGPNPPLFLAPIVEVVGNEARIDPGFIALQDEASPVTVAHAGHQRVGGESPTLTFESWNPKTLRGDEVNGVIVNSWGINVQYSQGQQGPQAVQQSFGLAALRQTQITSQIPLATAPADGADPFHSGSSFGDQVNPLAGFGYRHDGVVVTPEVFFSQIQVQFQQQDRNRAGAGHDEWKRKIRDNDQALTLTVTFGRRETLGDSLQDLLIDGALAKADAAIGFGFADALGRRCYLYMPRMTPDSWRIPGNAKSGDDEVTITYRGHEEADPLWGLLLLAWFDAPN